MSKIPNNSGRENSVESTKRKGVLCNRPGARKKHGEPGSLVTDADTTLLSLNIGRKVLAKEGIRGMKLFGRTQSLDAPKHRHVSKRFVLPIQSALWRPPTSKIRLASHHDLLEWASVRDSQRSAGESPRAAGKQSSGTREKIKRKSNKKKVSEEKDETTGRKLTVQDGPPGMTKGKNCSRIDHTVNSASEKDQLPEQKSFGKKLH